MKLWISGRIDYDIDNIFFGNVLHSVEDTVNEVIQKKNYGDAIDSWDIIMVIFKDCNNESEQFKYSSKEKETDIEVCVNHNNFKNGDLKNGKKLFFEALLYSFEKMKGHKKLKDFDFENLIKDVQQIRANN